MSRLLAFGVMGLLLAAVPAAAETTAQPEPQNRDSEIICKTTAADPGSRIGVRKVCMTRGEWERKRQRDQAGLVQTQQNGLLANQP